MPCRRMPSERHLGRTEAAVRRRAWGRVARSGAADLSVENDVAGVQ